MNRTVCIVCDGHWGQVRGGAEYQLHLLANELVERGYHLHYVFLDRGNKIANSRVSLEPMQLPSILKTTLYPYQFMLRKQLIRILDKIAPDIIINRVGNALTGYCAGYAATNNLPMIWHIANITDLLPWQFKFSRTVVCSYIDKVLLNRGIRNVSSIIAQAQYQSAMLSKNFGRYADIIVPNFHPDESSAPRKEKPLVILWTANIKPKKRPEEFIRLAHRFSDRSDMRFVMVGRPAENRYQKGIDRLLASCPNVDFRGELQIEEVNRLLCGAGIFVNTSLFEGFPNTFVQAWIRAVPVVSLQFDPDDVIRRNGLGFHSGDFEQLCKHIDLLAHDRGLREEIGVRARNHALAVHNVDQNVDKIVSLIETNLMSHK